MNQKKCVEGGNMPQEVYEHYHYLRERFTSQGDRLWKRFYYFLTVEVALVGAFLIKEGAIIPANEYKFIVNNIGLVLSVIWFLIGAQDIWYYDNARRRLDRYKFKNIIPLITNWTENEERETLPNITAKMVWRFRIPKFGVGSFASMIPLISIGLWVYLRMYL